MRFFGEAALTWPFSNTNRADLPLIGTVKVRPEGDLGWSAEAGFRAGRVHIAFYYEMVNFSRSDEIAVPVGVGMAVFFAQPESESSAYGITVGWLF